MLHCFIDFCIFFIISMTRVSLFVLSSKLNHYSKISTSSLSSPSYEFHFLCYQITIQTIEKSITILYFKVNGLKSHHYSKRRLPYVRNWRIPGSQNDPKILIQIYSYEYRNQINISRHFFFLLYRLNYPIKGSSRNNCKNIPSISQIYFIFESL